MSNTQCTQPQWRIQGMAGMARAMGATLMGAQNFVAKIKYLITAS